jgi:hypothetical protein
VFLDEIAMLKQACEQQEQELLDLRAIQRAQARVKKQLDGVERDMHEQRNSLDLEARAFDNDQEQYNKVLMELEGDIERVSFSKFQLLRMLFDVKVDKNLVYPTINNLRLAHRPCDKVTVNEIQVAWSLAAQLVLATANAFGFQSAHFTIVPLAHCAKLIYYATNATDNKAVVYNLGQSSQGLMCFHSLLQQVVRHATQQVQRAVERELLDAQFLIRSEAAVGVTQLDRNDKASWSRVICSMAKDMEWLLESASALVLQKVVLETSSLGLS